jgi:hypothetical protein
MVALMDIVAVEPAVPAISRDYHPSGAARASGAGAEGKGRGERTDSTATLTSGEGVGPDDWVLRRAQALPIFVDASGRRRRRTYQVGWLVSVACLVYLGLIAVSMSGTRIGALLTIPPVTQGVVSFPDDPGPPGVLELPPPAPAAPTRAVSTRTGTAVATHRPMIRFAATRVGSTTGQTRRQVGQAQRLALRSSRVQTPARRGAADHLMMTVLGSASP